MSMRVDTGVHAGVYSPHLLVHALNRDLDRAVVVFDGGGTVRAGELRDLVSTFIQALESMGVRPGTRVGLLAKNRPEVVFVMTALRIMAACTVPLHPMGSLDDLDYIVGDAQIEVLLFDPDHLQRMATELQARRGGIRHLLALGPSQVGTDLAGLAAGFAPGPLRAPDVDGEHLSRISYSGGTTGLPKGVMLTERSQLATASILMQEWEWPVQIRHLVCAPLSHSGASVLTPVLMKGGSLVVLPGFEPVAVMQAIEKHRITSTLVVPTMIYALLDHPRFGEFDLSSLETVFYGASSISPPRLREAIERMGPVFFQFYGQSEAPMSVTVLRRAEHDPTDLRRLASCGRPVPWVHAELLDDAGQPVADGEPGEICVRGPLVAAGYLNKPEQTTEAFAGGWLHTGDVAVRDPDGWWRIVDRKKDMIVTGGFNVYPREVEDVIATHPAVAAVAVIGVPDEHWGEAVKAVVVRRAGAAVAAEALIALVRDKKGPVQAPKSVDFVDAIPLTGLGKPDKKTLRKRFT
ncbi:MAG: AMP-binding protein [Burkholderiales bacterium]